MTKEDVVIEPYQDRSTPVEARVEDLLGRLTLADKAGLMFHDIVALGPGGSLCTRRRGALLRADSACRTSTRRL